MKKAILQGSILGKALCVLSIFLMPYTALGAAEGATNSTQDPDVWARYVNERLLSLIKESAHKKDLSEYYHKVGEILDEIVDFSRFTKNVVGRYGSKKTLEALSKKERSDFLKGIQRLESVIRSQIIETYGKVMLTGADKKISLQPIDPKQKKRKKMTVVQNVYDPAQKKTIKINYIIGRTPDNQLKLRNIHIESLNIGKLYRKQFSDAYRKYKGDMDKIIAGWKSL